MSSYAALVSLLQILVAFPDYNRFLMDLSTHRAQYLERVNFLLDFLENSCSTTSKGEVERIMREAAYKAEDIFEELFSGISSFERRRLCMSIKMAFVKFLEPLLLPVFIPAFMFAIYKHFFLTAISMIIFVFVIIFAQFLLIALSEGEEFADRFFLVVRDFDIIVNEVIGLRMNQEMSAYSALISLRSILDSILADSGRVQASFSCTQLESLHGKVIFFLDFLEDCSDEQVLDAKIRRAVDKAIATILLIPPMPRVDSKRTIDAVLKLMFVGFSSFPYALNNMYDPPGPPPKLFIFFVRPALCYNLFLLCWIFYVNRDDLLEKRRISEQEENQELRLVIDDLSCLMRDAVKIRDACRNPSDLPASSSSGQGLGGFGKNVVVGFEMDLQRIKDRLVQDSPKLEIISVVGMGGIGKTTLAREVYAHPDIVYHFDIRAWVTVSQDYSLLHVLLRLLNSAKTLTKWVEEDGDVERLGEQFYRYLLGRRYLIVIDDVWDTNILDFIRRFMPDDCDGSRVLLTSRLSNVARYLDSSSPLHQMQCLNANDSWHLLCDRVFGEECCCPKKLEAIGMTIALSCKGLPLAIVVISGILYNEQRTELAWMCISEKIISILCRDDEHCSELLGLSYEHLPHRLKPCFMYMGAFPEDKEISITKLVNLWAAEGFLKPSDSKSLEEVAEEHLKDLVQRSLIMVGKRSCNGKIKTFKIHDLLREVCLLNAQKENFLYVVDWGGYRTREMPTGEKPRRLSICSDALQIEVNHGLLSSYQHVRSFLCTSELLNYPYIFYLSFLYLRVLDVVVVQFDMFPDQIIKLLHLRYLAFYYNGPLPSFISKLQNLQTIVHHHCSSCKYPLLPRVIWSMPKLRHLYVKPGCFLSHPLGYPLQWKISILEHLQTLVGIRNFIWNKGIMRRIPNLKKLDIWYDVSSSVDWSAYQLNCLVDLDQLETLKITIQNDDLGSSVSDNYPKLVFPQKLKILTLSGCGIPWAIMRMIGALPDLEVMKLKCEACSGPLWETVEGEFPKLVYLLLEQMRFSRWETDDASHFPHLQRLVIRSCGKLEEIPFAVGDIPTLEKIELVNCHPSAVASAEQIQKEQESMGNDELKVCYIP